VEGPQREKYIGRLDFFNINQDEGTISNVIAEQTLVSAFLYVTREDLPVAVFSDGHNEDQNDSLTNLFENNSYIVKRAALAVQDLADDTEIFVIMAPTRDFSVDEIKKLDAFMGKGGKIIAFVEPGVEAMPNLEEFFAEWGIRVRPEVVLEKDLYVANNPLNLHATYAPHVINNYFVNNRYYPVLPACRALEMVDVPGGVTSSPVLISSSDSYGKTGESFSTLQREANDAAGPFDLAITSQKQIVTAEGEKQAKIFVAGSSMMYSPDILSMDSYANADFIVQVINWCTDSDKGVHIAAKKLTPDPMNIMTYQSFLFGIAFIIIIPLGVLIYGIVVFVRRRHL
jgi:ABC-2 type transport system permease protein